MEMRMKTKLERDRMEVERMLRELEEHKRVMAARKATEACLSLNGIRYQGVAYASAERIVCMMRDVLLDPERASTADEAVTEGYVMGRDRLLDRVLLMTETISEAEMRMVYELAVLLTSRPWEQESETDK
jgi:hypothetical protein